MVVTAFSIRLALFMVIFLYSLYPKFLSLGVAEQGFALTGQRAMLYVMLGALVIHALWGSADVRRGMQIARQYKWVFVWVFVCLGARLVGNALSGRLDMGAFAAFVNQSVVSILVLYLVVALITSRQDVKIVLGLVVVSLFINQMGAITEYISGQSLFPENLDLQYQTDADPRLLEGSTRAGHYRSRAFFDNPLKLTGFLCLAFPLCIGLVQTSKTFVLKVLFTVPVLLAPVVAVFTGSRTALVVMFLMLIWYAHAAATRGLARHMRVIVGAASVGILVVIAMVAGGLAESLLFESDYARSTESRLFQYVRVPLALADSPVFGFGFARNIIDLVDIGHVDSFYLQTALEGGLVALFALLAAHFLGFRLALLTARSSCDNELVKLAGSLTVALAAAFVMSLVISMSSIRFYVFLLLGLAMVVHNLGMDSVRKQGE